MLANIILGCRRMVKRFLAQVRRLFLDFAGWLGSGGP